MKNWYLPTTLLYRRKHVTTVVISFLGLSVFFGVLMVHFGAVSNAQFTSNNVYSHDKARNAIASNTRTSDGSIVPQCDGSAAKGTRHIAYVGAFTPTGGDFYLDIFGNSMRCAGNGGTATGVSNELTSVTVQDPSGIITPVFSGAYTLYTGRSAATNSFVFPVGNDPQIAGFGLNNTGGIRLTYDSPVGLMNGTYTVRVKFYVCSFVTSCDDRGNMTAQITYNGPPPIGGTLSCGSVTQSSINLNWGTSNTTNAAITRPGFSTLTSTTPDVSSTSTGNGTGISSGLTAGTSYTYTIRNNGSNGTALASVTCTTSPQITVSCARSGAGTVYVGQSVSFTGSSTNASGNYTWTGGLPTNGTASGANNGTYTTSWNTASATHYVDVTRSGVTSRCFIAISNVPAATCANRTDSIWATRVKTYTITATNPGSTSATVSVSYSVTGGSPGGSIAARSIGAGGTADYTSGNITPSAPTMTITWTVSTVNAASTSSCTTTVTVHALPTCTVTAINASAGAPFKTSAVISKPVGSPAVTINSVPATKYTHTLTPAVPAALVTNLSGTATSVSATNKVTINNATVTAEQKDTSRIAAPTSDKVDWQLNWTGGGLTATTATCSKTISITVVPVVCSVNPVTSEPDRGFEVSVTLTNPNLIPIKINSANWSVASGNPPSGAGIISWDSPATDKIPPNNNSRTITSDSKQIKIPTTGEYAITWSNITTEYADSNPSGDGCVGAKSAEINALPYVRFYGNDVVAGGEFGECAVPTTGISAKVRTKGDYKQGATTKDHSTFQGAASELAVFAYDQINGLLPGAQVTSRSAIAALAFANTGAPNGIINASGLDFGGGFQSPLCGASFPTADDDFVDWTGSDLNKTGKFSSNSNVTINASTIDNGVRVKLLVEGDVTITGNITYNTATPWSDKSEIPLVQIYATGNIYIDGDVEQLDGMYQAKGTIYSCTNGSSIFALPLSDASKLSMNDKCGKKLTVNGGFVASRVSLQRIIGTVSAGGVAENYDSASIAEVFRFSPELYLALLSEGAESNTNKFDSLLSLPPAF